jgi:hypothetical protein
MTDYLIQDDISYLGLRRLHVMRPDAPVEEGQYLARIAEEDGELLLDLRWVDELENHHYLAAWRLNMDYPMWCMKFNGDFGLAVSQAARSYQVRFGLLPNRVRTLCREDLPPWVELAQEDGAVIQRIEIEAVENNFPARVVGVYSVQEASDGS